SAAQMGRKRKGRRRRALSLDAIDFRKPRTVALRRRLRQHDVTDSLNSGKGDDMPTRNASATWNGDLKSGNGNFKGSSGALQGNYSFGTRFESAPGTNPEELIAAAHASCFSMALSAGLGKNGFKPERVSTTAAVTIDKVGEGFKITKIKLT